MGPQGFSCETEPFLRKSSTSFGGASRKRWAVRHPTPVLGGKERLGPHLERALWVLKMRASQLGEAVLWPLNTFSTPRCLVGPPSYLVMPRL